MADQDDFIRTALRVPPELHKKIHEEAKAANRTFNAEILARILATFSDDMSFHRRDVPLVRVVLDSRGYPQSWDEIHAHLTAIRTTLDKDVISMQSQILTPDMVSSSERRTEAKELEKFYDEKSSNKDSADFVWPTTKPRKHSK